MDNQSKRVIPLRTTDTIRQEAAEWLVKLDNRLDSKSLSPSDLESLRAWLAQDPRCGQILKRQAAIWSDMDIYAKAIEEPDCEPKISFWSLLISTKPLRNSLVFACTMLMMIGTWFYVSSYDAYDANLQLYATSVGGQRIETFNDGSTAHLNTDSLIEIDFSDTERKITLLRGEALFDVAHDPDRPFIVYAEGKAVRAIGTKFIVRLTSQRIMVTVAEGQVQLSSQPKVEGIEASASAAEKVQEVIVLSEGEAAEVSVDKPDMPVLINMDKEEFERKFSWTNGRLIFVDETLQTIINEVNRYTSIRVVILDKELKDIRLSGRFQIGDTEALLEAIEISRKDIHINRNQDGNMIYISSDSG